MDEYELPELNRVEERFRKKIQSKIFYCSYCQPYDGGEVVWIHGDRVELYELLEEFDVPENIQSKIFLHLVCPNCANTEFSAGSEIGLKTQYEKDIDKNLEKAKSLYGNQIKRFNSFLDDYPLLAYQDKFAKKIYREILSGKFPQDEVKGLFYRARQIEGSAVRVSTEMLNPPLGKSQEGRFNHAGQSHLYLSSDKSTALKEVTSDIGSVIVWSQEFNISKPIPKILDLSFDWTLLTPSTSAILLSLNVHNVLNRKDRNQENYRPDYYLTRFIMDCAKLAGYNGIKYNSAKNSWHYDIVLFYRDKIEITPNGDPKVETLKIENQKSRNKDL